MEDVSVDHLSIDGHERPQVDVDAVRAQTHQRQDVEEELGPQSQILHDEGEGEHLSRLVPDERLLRVGVHQLQSRRRDKKLQNITLHLFGTTIQTFCSCVFDSFFKINTGVSAANETKHLFVLSLTVTVTLI